MPLVTNAILGTIVFSAVLGAIASLKDDKSGLGREFLEGLHAIGAIFIPVAGIMASIPILSKAVKAIAGPLFELFGADPAIAATSLIAVDMGGYQLAHAIAATPEAQILSMLVGYMGGATIVFSIPVGLALLDKKDHPYLALGVLSGALAIPIGVAVGVALIAVFGISVRPDVSTQSPSTQALAFSIPWTLRNLVPLVVFVVSLASSLRFFPQLMIRLFMYFGRGMEITIRIVLAASIVELFTGLFSKLGSWPFDPIVADKADPVRALEVAGYIGLMLAGAFPLVYLIRKYLGKFLEAGGRQMGLEPAGAAGIIASIANILAMFHLVKDMRPEDKVINIAFAVCSAFLLGDHLAFTANFQPNLILPVFVGKLVGGCVGVALAYRLSVPYARALSRRQILSVINEKGS